MENKYSEITEIPGQIATQEQLERLHQRYHFASKYVTGGVVLEVGCGIGLGLGYLTKTASRVYAGDIDETNVEVATKKYQEHGEISILNLDAQDMPFEDECFDTILLLETLYYLEKPEQFISEAHRLLKNEGHLIICTVNSSWKDCHPSKYSCKYFSVPELYALLHALFVHSEIYGAFEVTDSGLKTKIVSLTRRIASRLHLIPGSLEAREPLKRIFIGRLRPIPPEIEDGMTTYNEPVPIESNCPTDKYKILYAVAIK